AYHGLAGEARSMVPTAYGLASEARSMVPTAYGLASEARSMVPTATASQARHAPRCRPLRPRQRGTLHGADRYNNSAALSGRGLLKIATRAESLSALA
ncbi:MAG: hypothetical protein WBZ19_17840, partial [Chthoniobacterales bacterium]